jgi:hypothetical protein
VVNLIFFQLTSTISLPLKPISSIIINIVQIEKTIKTSYSGNNITKQACEREHELVNRNEYFWNIFMIGIEYS